MGYYLAVLLAMLPVLAAAETASHDLSIVTGRGELLQFANDVTQVAASEPKIADVVVISPREVMINGKGSGRATVVIWETGSVPARYNIDVLPDTFEFDQFRKQLRAGLPGSNIEVTGKGDTIVLSGTVASLEQSKEAAGLASSRSKNVVNLLQAPPLPDARQILLQVKFASIDRTALTEIGFNLFSRNPTFLGELTTEQFQSPRFSQLQFQNQAFSNSTVNFADLLNLFAFRPDLNIGATIKALQGRNLLQILAEPNLITLEGKEASFLAGGSFPFPVLTTTSTGGSTSPVVTVQFKPFGVQLTFTPTITNSGAIQLKVAPEVSSLDFANAVTLQGFLIPAISQRRAETEVILKDGESFAIAGLMDNRVLQDINQIPWLGSIPILGNLFRSRSTRKTSDELLVVITPHFVSPLTADEKARMPDFEQTFLPTIADEKAKKAGKAKHKDDTPQPEFVGPRGHQEPN
ncbi:MAG: pilus assembly protein N-terminal domain-containing protein [Acidobacteriota bacterium]|nr:pilus assembly protein N-terminal domain-containing protein [Acidobacteriota bacterium]